MRSGIPPVPHPSLRGGISTNRPAPRTSDRPALLKTFRNYLSANDLEADWGSISRAENGDACQRAVHDGTLTVRPKKQALLEAPDLKMRAETLIAITEIAMAQRAR